jgi:ABC-type uncharacterized transport system auxiliary subunit
MKTVIYFLIIPFIVLTSCLSERKIVRNYFTIEIPAGGLPVKTDSTSAITGICEIAQVEVNQVYANNQIVNRTGSNVISYYVYNQWAIRPADAIKELIHEYLDTEGIFQSTTAGNRRPATDYRFLTSVNRLEMIEKNNSPFAHIDLEFRIINNSNDRVILSHKSDRTIAIEKRDLNLFAQEVSKTICEELSVFSTMIKGNRYIFKASH